MMPPSHNFACENHVTTIVKLSKTTVLVNAFCFLNHCKKYEALFTGKYRKKKLEGQEGKKN